MLQTRRLAGIRFEAQPPAPAIVLPRMDVAGFVGYASSGPLDTPVPVDDPARFTEIFGPDLAVAWDGPRGEIAYAALGPVVRSFFRNGGRRCFAVRVADVGARTTTFQLPGLVALTEDGPRNALLRARSVGAWADGLRVAVSVSSSPLVVRPVSYRAGTFDVVSPDADAVRPGDLVRLSFSDADDWTLLATVATATLPRLSAQTVSEERERVTVMRVVTDAMLWTQPAKLPDPWAGRVVWIGPHGATRSSAATLDDVRGRSLLRIGSALDVAPVEGALVRIKGESPDLWARIDDRGPHGAGTRLAFTAFRLRRTPPPGLPRSRARRGAERVELELWTEQGGARMRLGGLGFGRRHPRFLADLPTDERLYADAADALASGWPELWRSAAEPRFPLAGPVERPAAYFPLGASLLPESSLGALPPLGSVRRRNGLARLHSSVFVDQRLESLRTEVLCAQADYMRYVAPDRPPSAEDRARERQDDPDPQRLRGIHALLGVEQVTMVGVPDAALAGWHSDRPPPPAPPSPGADPEGPEEGSFAACEAPLLRRPELRLSSDRIGLEWVPPPTGTEVEIDEATDDAFDTATPLYRGAASELALGGRPPGTHWYRARYRAGTVTGPWSAAGPVGTAPRPEAAVREPDEYTDGVLVSVHRALVRMCAARRDLFALLTVPEHYREDAAIGHAATLRTGRSWPRMDVPPLDTSELYALGYAALHHPWLVVTNPDRPDELRRVPPDGATAGVLAKRAAQRGAWVAPANVALLDVVALSPGLSPERRLELLAAQVNGIEQTPRGFMALAADTLSSDEDWRQINVRRLLQLLRRLALRHGETYAFEPNGEALRRAAQRGFEAVLGALFRLGAFAGQRPDEGFRVTVGDPPNTLQSVEAGRLIVELRVAPSRPLVFLTVRLVRAGDGTIRVETV